MITVQKFDYFSNNYYYKISDLYYKLRYRLAPPHGRHFALQKERELISEENGLVFKGRRNDLNVTMVFVIWLSFVKGQILK